MAALNSISPSTQILDDSGYDWAWAFVVFRDVPGFPGYMVGSDGSVWSRIRLKSLGCGKGTAATLGGQWHLRRTSINRYGYETVALHRSRVSRRFRVHAMVLLAFVGPPAIGQECRHMDGIRSNNQLRNIRWGTKQENTEDRIRHGTSARGEGHARSKLTEVNVHAIREMAAKGVPRKQIANKFGVSNVLIGLILKGKIWRHVGPVPLANFMEFVLLQSESVGSHEIPRFHKVEEWP